MSCEQVPLPPGCLTPEQVEEQAPWITTTTTTTSPAPLQQLPNTGNGEIFLFAMLAILLLLGGFLLLLIAVFTHKRETT